MASRSVWGESEDIIVNAVVVTQTPHTACEVVAQKASTAMFFAKQLIAVTLPSRDLRGVLTNRTIRRTLRARTGLNWLPEKIAVVRLWSVKPLVVVNFFCKVDPTELLGLNHHLRLRR